MTAPRHANVLTLENCKNVTLTGFTAGHTPDSGVCSGGVIRVLDSEALELKQLGLFGCGITGFRGERVEKLTLADCQIYDCSSSGVFLSECQTVQLERCTLRSIGKQQEGTYTGFSLLSLDTVTDLRMENCTVEDSTTHYLLDSRGSEEIYFRETVFQDNGVLSAAFELDSSLVYLENCCFRDNRIRRWCNQGMCPIDENGEVLTEELLEERYGAREPAEAAPQTRVEAATVDEFLAAIGPDTEIILTGEIYDLSTATGYGVTGTEYYTWEECFDGCALVIWGVRNLTIRGQSGDRTGHQILAVPRYADVLFFNRCQDITLSAFTAGHTEKAGYCEGGVLEFADSDALTVENCGLFGCGTVGITAWGCSDFRITGCEIYECSVGGIEMRNVTGITLEDTDFRDLGGFCTQLRECRDVTVNGVKLDDPE